MANKKFYDEKQALKTILRDDVKSYLKKKLKKKGAKFAGLKISLLLFLYDVLWRSVIVPFIHKEQAKRSGRKTEKQVKKEGINVKKEADQFGDLLLAVRDANARRRVRESGS